MDDRGRGGESADGLEKRLQQRIVELRQGDFQVRGEDADG